MSTKPSKTAGRLMRMNARGLEGALQGKLGESHGFGRILKTFDGVQMLVKLTDGKEVKATTRGGLRKGGRNAPTKMLPGSIVVLALPDKSIASTTAITHLIEAKLTDRKDMVRLMKMGILPEWMVLVADVSEIREAKAEVEDGYEFTTEIDDDGAAAGAGAGADDIDISTI